jgi:hypothetical protein
MELFHGWLPNRFELKIRPPANRSGDRDQGERVQDVDQRPEDFLWAGERAAQPKEW